MAALVLACLWVLAASAVAFLPMRYQYAPGALLLLAVPVVIWALGREFGWGWSVVGVLAFVSMFRRPLGGLARRLRGRAE